MHDTPLKHPKHPAEAQETAQYDGGRERARDPFGIQKETDKAPRPVPTGEFSLLQPEFRFRIMLPFPAMGTQRVMVDCDRHGN